MNSPRLLSSSQDRSLGLARPQISVSESRIPDYLSIEGGTRCRSFTASQENIHASDCEFEWVLRLMQAQDVTYMRPYLPDLFVSWKSGRTVTAFTGCGSDTVKKSKGAEAWGSFFFQPTDVPRTYQVSHSNAWKTFPAIEDAHEFATITRDSYLIAALPEKPRKIRLVQWRRDARLEEYIPGVTRSRNSSPRNSVFQHDIGKFRYAGRLKKSSFSPYLPYSSVLTDKLPRSAGVNPDVTELIQSVRLFLTKDRFSLHSMTLHVAEDLSGSVSLLNVTDLLWAEKERKTLPPIIAVCNSTPTLPDIVQPKSDTKRSAESLFARPLVRPPYIDSSEIQRKNIDMYARTFSDRAWRTEEVPEAVPAPLSPVARSLNQIAERFDQQRQQLEVSRLIHSKTAKLGINFKDLIRKAYGRFERDDLLSRFFHSDTGVQHLSEQFYMAITTPKNYYLSRRIHSVHQRYGITLEHFEQFLAKFREVMHEHGVSEEDADMVVSNIMSYKQDVVSSS